VDKDSERLRHSQAFDHRIDFESYGVPCRIETNDATLLEKVEKVVRKALLDRLKIIEKKTPEHIFGFAVDDAGMLSMFHDGQQLASDEQERRLFKYFNSVVRIVVAEHARGSVFVHSGVVGWNGKAILIPANSFAGKTTLVAELVRNGAEYYSDEYAVLDENGLVHPFPRHLSVRYGPEYDHTDVPVEDLGGRSGVDAIRVGMVLLVEYKAGAVWDPTRLTPGQGMLEVIPHTIPRNFNAEFSLKVLNTALKDAIILKGRRGDARLFAKEFLSRSYDFGN
jgi:hypothetical protein